MELLLIITALTLGSLIVFLTVPPIIRVANAKKLFEPFDERKVHTQVVPPLGGVAIFISFLLATIIATDGYSFDCLKYIIASVTIMFFIGLKDDLLIISARKKFVVQIFASVLLVVLGEVYISDMHGLMGMHQIHYFTSLFVSLFIMLAIVNAFNLIDGIDGLASGLAILASLFFGIWFFISGHIQFAIMSLALTGSLTGFFIYNVFGKDYKLFMGDTGSLVIGLIISALVIKFNEFNTVKTVRYAFDAAPVISFAVIITPLIDTLRVMTIRIMQGRSPFYPDKNHIHHLILKRVPRHLHVTLIIIAGNIGMIGLALFFNYLNFNINLQFILIFIVAVAISLIPSLALRSNIIAERSTVSLKVPK